MELNMSRIQSRFFMYMRDFQSPSNCCLVAEKNSRTMGNGVCHVVGECPCPNASFEAKTNHHLQIGKAESGDSLSQQA
jgi:hypothetical protein